MRFLAGVALLVVLVVAEGHHLPEHTLRGPRYVAGKVHVYDVEFNVTSGIQGLSSQVSKSAFKAELQIYAKSGNTHILKVTNVHTSGSVKATDNKNGFVSMEKNQDLEKMLSTPIKFTMENGEITSYTLSPRESLESKKIKKAILRSLEMHVPEAALQQMESPNLSQRVPVFYNVTKALGMDQHTVHYLITVSPDIEFPYNNMVYNISRSENFEGERYHSHKFHHNFRQQGCSSACRMDWRTNEYGAGCPSGYEPHQSPMKTYVHHQHHFALENDVMTPETIRTVEVHTAKMYDQDMEVLIRLQIKKTGYSRRVFEEPTGQPTYTNLEDQEPEIDENEIEAKCENKSPKEVLEAAKVLLTDIANIVAEGDLETKESTLIGEKIILLKSALSKLKASDLKLLAESEITKKGSLRTAKEELKIKRQIWMDILPLIGTQESVSFIVSYIKENIDRDLFIWEAKEILEALPNNIHVPSEKVISELRTLLTLSKTKKNHLLHSAAHLCLARVISSMCNGKETVSSVSKPIQQLSWFPGNQESFRNLEQASRSDSHSPVQCPIELVSEIVQDIVQKLKATQKKDEIIIYLEFLSQTGVSEALPVVTDYAYGTADNLQDLVPSYIEFVKSAAIYSLHSVIERHPEDVLEIVVPLFFNETESPKIRTAAFGVLIRGQPSLEVLQHVAVRSWSEKSNEVGSFVTSSMDTFGNNTLPCMQLTAHRIKQVMPMLKRFDIGLQHAKNLLWSYFDDFRMFGVGSHLIYTPSNASIIPSAIYYALSYSTDSLSDTLIQNALNIQGLTQEKIFNFIDENILGAAPIENIPSSKENEIFEEAKIVERIPESLRFTLYKRMFYSSSFYYLDLNNMKSQVDILLEYLRTYLMKTPLDYSGHIVKVFLPSSLHTVTIAKSLPYPVEFQMHQPVVLALKIESKERNPSLSKFHFLIKPSVYLTKLFTNQLKNVGDCKEMGVYHEHKMAISYPIQIKFEVPGLMNVTLRYKLPELPKKVLYYFSESGTYAGRKSLETLPSSEDRMPIRTLPSAFKNSTTINLIGLPPFHVETHTEEIGLGMEDSPSNPWKVLDFTVRRVLNAGWRYKAANVTFEDNSRVWPKDTEVTLTMQYNRSHVSQRNLKMSRQQDSNPWPESKSQNSFSSDEWMTTESEEDLVTEQSPQQWFWGENRKDEDVDDAWREGLKPDDIPRIKNPSIFAEQARRIASKVSSSIPHIRHVFNVGLETSPVYSSVHMKLEYNHTHTKSLHAVHVDTAVKVPHERAIRKISLDHLMGFSGKPDEFQYDAHSHDHSATFITALRSHPIECSCPWKDVEVIAKGEFQFEPLDSILNNELESSVERKYFMSEQHDQCVKDTEDGQPQSMSCLKAIREQSIYNKLKMSVLWKKELPNGITNLARRLDTFMKHIYYNHMALDYRPNMENKIDVTLNHIDKLTDKPVFDMTIKKPEETITFRRMRTIGLAVSSVHDVLGVDLMELTNDTYPPTCIMMEKSVKTYDLKYYPLSLDQCSYVLSTHCTEYKNFAIISKVLSADGLKEIHFHVGPHTLIMSPKAGDHFTIKYDDQDYIVSEPLVFDEDTAEIYAFSERYASGHSHLEVVAHKAGVRIIYDGKNIKIQIHPRYKGETCGLCSEFDGEIIREYRGVDKCLYSHPADFVNSAITNREVCKKQATHPYICEEEANMIWRQTGTEDKYKPTIKRNVVLLKGDEICFSVRALPVCESNSKPVETESLQAGFHCLPKQDVTARRMVSEAKRRSLGEIENKSIDYEENIEVATMC